jgi:RNA polymerase sigma-70 factor (ECF subfamily)
MNDASDEEILAAIAAGPGAFPEFYRRNVARVTGMGVRRFDTPEDVADFVANVFLEVLSSADRFDPRRGTAITWLYGVAGNVAARMYRREARRAQAERQLAGRAFLDADDHARVEERIDAATRLRRTYRALQHLQEQDRRLLELIAVDGLSTGEAARVLSISPVAARVRLSRARGRLETALAAGDQEKAPPFGPGTGRRVRPYVGADLAPEAGLGARKGSA